MPLLGRQGSRGPGGPPAPIMTQPAFSFFKDDANAAPAPPTPDLPPERPTFYILDAYSLIYQVFHAIPLMTSPSGQPTQAVFGIFRDLLNLARDRKPDYLAAAFDGAGPVFRSDLFADYKAQRA